MGNLDESDNATTNNDNDNDIKFGSNKNSISFESSSSSTASDFSPEDLQILDTKHDEKHDENSSNPETIPIPSQVVSKKIFTGPGNWSMASNESLFSINMGGASFCHLDSLSPLFDLPYDLQFVDGKIPETDEENNQGNRFSATSGSSSNSLVFPILSGETEENGGSPCPRGSLIGPVPLSPPQPEPAPEPRSQPKASGAEPEAEAKERRTYMAWTVWFPCFRYCACCS